MGCPRTLNDVFSKIGTPLISPNPFEKTPEPEIVFLGYRLNTGRPVNMSNRWELLPVRRSDVRHEQHVSVDCLLTPFYLEESRCCFYRDRWGKPDETPRVS